MWYEFSSEKCMEKMPPLTWLGSDCLSHLQRARTPLNTADITAGVCSLGTWKQVHNSIRLPWKKGSLFSPSLSMTRTRTHWERPWCWERLKVGGKGDDRGWDGWMASPTRWTWVWVNSRSQWWTGRPGMVRFMGSQSRTRLNWTELETRTVKFHPVSNLFGFVYLVIWIHHSKDCHSWEYPSVGPWLTSFIRVSLNWQMRTFKNLNNACE